MTTHYQKEKKYCLLFISATLASLCGVLLTRIYIMDDALITLRYSLNFARFGVPIWNQADLAAPSMGYTSLLWMGLNAIPALITNNRDILILIAKAFSFAALLAICGVICKEIAELSILTLQKIVVVVLIFTQFGYGLHVNSAMETMLFSLFMLLTVRSYAKDRYGQAYVFSALAFLTRPEGAILCALVFLADLARRKVKRVAFAAAGFLLLLAVLYALLMTWYGDFLPNTFYAKQELFNLTAFKRTILFIVTVALPFIGLSLYSAISRKSKAAVFALVASLTFMLYYLSVDPIMNVMSRYQWPCLVLLTLGSLPAVEHLLQNARKNRIALAVLVLVAVGVNAGNAMGASYFASATGHSEQNIISIGKAMAAYRQPDRWLIYHDAGAVCYFSDWNTFETIGLTNGELARKQTTLDAIYAQPKALIAMRNFDLSSEKQYEYLADYTSHLSSYGFEHIGNIPVLYVEGQRNFVISVYARDRQVAAKVLSDIDIEESYKPDFTYKLYQVAKRYFGR